MKKLYEKSELWFALVCIAVYMLGQSFANDFNKLIGVDYSANLILNLFLTVILFVFIKKNGLMEYYGLCKAKTGAKKFLWFIPLAVIASHNLWYGFGKNFTFGVLLCYISYMLFVGFVEEMLFRGLLFKALAKDNVKLAAAISSVTFGLGHIINLINGNSNSIVEEICQVAAAIALGFLFVTIFSCGGSLWPCIITHSAIDIISAFANEEALTETRRIAAVLIWLVITVAYTLVLLKTLPKNTKE